MGTFAGTVFAGAAFENVALGVGFGLGFMVGGPVRFALSARASGPIDYSGDFALQVDVDAGLRVLIDAGSLTPHFFLLADYGRGWEFEGDNTYEYNLYQARIGGGILFGNGRVRKGFEVGVHIGKRVHANTDENPWGEDYSSDGATFAGSIRFVLTL